MSEKVRVPTIQCPRCDFNNPDGTELCFDCGATLDKVPNRLTTVRRRRCSATAISLSELAAVRARLRALSEELRPPRRLVATTGHGRRRVPTLVLAIAPAEE